MILTWWQVFFFSKTLYDLIGNITLFTQKTHKNTEKINIKSGLYYRAFTAQAQGSRVRNILTMRALSGLIPNTF